MLPRPHARLLSVLLLWLLGGCVAADREEASAQAHFQASIERMTAGDPDGALDALRASFEAGYPTPMDVASDPVLKALLAEPTTRADIVDLLHASARERAFTMVAPTEPGPPLALTIRVVDRATGRVVPNARVRVQHTDAAGYYFHEDSEWNPRLVGAGKTDTDGTVHVVTILPGYYAEAYDPAGEVPRHVHYEVDADGFYGRASEAVFSDDSRPPPPDEPVLTIAMTGPAHGELTIDIGRRP